MNDTSTSGSELSTKQKALIEQGHGHQCEECGAFVFNWWDQCRECEGHGSIQVTLTDGGTEPGVRGRFERFHDDEIDVAARRDLQTGEVQVLVMTGRHHCGHSSTYLASSAKLPADEGGWFETSQCDGCLGTMEMNEEWWPKEDVLS